MTSQFRHSITHLSGKIKLYQHYFINEFENSLDAVWLSIELEILVIVQVTILYIYNSYNLGYKVLEKLRNSVHNKI